MLNFRFFLDLANELNIKCIYKNTRWTDEYFVSSGDDFYYEVSGCSNPSNYPCLSCSEIIDSSRIVYKLDYYRQFETTRK